MRALQANYSQNEWRPSKRINRKQLAVLAEPGSSTSRASRMFPWHGGASFVSGHHHPTGQSREMTLSAHRDSTGRRKRGHPNLIANRDPASAAAISSLMRRLIYLYLFCRPTSVPSYRQQGSCSISIDDSKATISASCGPGSYHNILLPPPIDVARFFFD
jgi:hypothetical protein